MWATSVIILFEVFRININFKIIFHKETPLDEYSDLTGKGWRC